MFIININFIFITFNSQNIMQNNPIDYLLEYCTSSPAKLDKSLF